MEEGMPEHEENELLRAERFNDIGMTLKEFLEEDEFCRDNNLPEGKGCSECEGEEREYCADELRHAQEHVILIFPNLRGK